MKQMFNKQTLEGHWFSENEEAPDNYTEKAPQHTNQIFSEELGGWVEKPAEEPEAETGDELLPGGELCREN
jgi:hypothetical protein